MTGEACSVCGRQFKVGFRPFYRQLCRKCYDRVKISCDHCEASIPAATSSQNQGCCFDCFYQHQRESDLTDSDRKTAVENFVNDRGVSLPDDYLAFLTQHTGNQRFVHPKTGDEKWWSLCTIARDLHGFPLDDESTKERFHSILVRLGHEHAEFANADELSNNNGGRFTVARLTGCFAIGSSDGDILFLDPGDKFSVWCFWHDGADVSKLAHSFSAFHSRCKFEFPTITTTSPDLLPLIPTFAGLWRAEKSRFFAAVELFVDTKAITKFKGGSETFEHWRMIDEKTIGVYRDAETRFEIVDQDSLLQPELKVTLTRSQGGITKA